MCQQHKLVVRFANTVGDILQDTQDPTTVTLDGFDDIKLGSCVYTERGLVVVDRTPADETTRLWVRDIINLIKYTRRIGVYRHQNAAKDDVVECECKTAEEEVVVYLPRMSGNMIEEAEYQRLLYSVGENVKLVPV